MFSLWARVLGGGGVNESEQRMRVAEMLRLLVDMYCICEGFRKDRIGNEYIWRR